MFLNLKRLCLSIHRKDLILLTPRINRKKSSLGLWHEDLNTDLKSNIESHWKEEVMQHIPTKSGRNSFYVLPMFPYPSGNLHMGHVRVYSISDAIARFRRLSGDNVIHPMGWDAFGLPAENAAIERDIPPGQWTRSNISSMKKQLHQLAFNFDWTREISTFDPEYYKWTQFIFLKLFENGLAYQKTAFVNWDPVDKTVLADEQVDDLGCSWRSGAKVEKKILKQWFIKTTKFAQKLYDGLEDPTLENWKDIINLQKHWIGECNGVVVNFKVTTDRGTQSLDVWTKEPYKFIHGQFITISKINVIAQQLQIDHRNADLIAYNPITDSVIPVYICDDVNYAEGCDVHIACPLSDDEDLKLAHMLNFTLNKDMCKQKFNIQSDNQRAIDVAQKKNVGGYFVSSKLKDWLISRQRYWGTPIPIIHCRDCGTVAVPYEQLPVKLPEVTSFGSGIQTLKSLDSWVNCKCPQCGKSAQRETDTMDTFVDSSWYYYRFLDPKNTEMPFDINKLVGNTPVNMYIGGKEHAVLHLYYARFMSHFLNSIGWTPNPEPFKKLIAQGMVMGQSYRVKSTGKYITPENVYQEGKAYREKETNEPLVVQWEKMSKSKYNGENPENLLSSYGCDTTRLFILADVPPASSRHWSNATFPGVLNWQHRIWMSMREFLRYRSSSTSEKATLSDKDFRNFERKLWESRNYFIATTTYHFKHTQQLSVGISRIQGLTNVLRNKVPPEIIARSGEFEQSLATLIIMLSPLAPHFCSELWAGLQSAPNRICGDSPLINWDKGVLEQSWPQVDDEFELSFQCKVDGADRCDLKIKASDLEMLNEQEAINIMAKEENVAKRVKQGILRTKFDLYPGCRAILHIFTKRKLKKETAVENAN